MLLDRLIDDRSAGNGGLHRLAAVVLAIAVQHAGKHFRQSVFTVLAGLFAAIPGSACLLAGLGSLLCGLVRLGKPLWTALVLLLLTGLLVGALLALRIGCRGLLLLFLAGSGILTLGFFSRVFLGSGLWRLAAFRLVGGL